MSASIGCSRPVTPVRTLLQVNIAVLVAMSGTIFACAEGAPLAAWTVPVALSGLILVDRRSVIHLNHWVINGLGLLAFGVASLEFYAASTLGRVLAFGHLLIYLAWVLMLQQKGARQFWLLCALSVLQVATSAVLTKQPWLGIALILYVTFALWTLSIFSLDRAVGRSVKVEQMATSPAKSAGPSASTSRNAVRLESAAKWITPRFIAGVWGNGLISIGMGLAIFVFIPRPWLDPLGFVSRELAPTARAISGFSDEVQLGDMGEILGRPDLVMEVTLTDTESEQPISPRQFLDQVGEDSLLMRGAVLGEYKNGRWSPVIGLARKHLTGRRILDSDLSYLRQEVRLLVSGSSALFAPQGVITCLPKSSEDDIEHEVLRNTYRRYVREDSPLSGTYEYAAYCLRAGQRQPWDARRYGRSKYLPRMAQLPQGLEVIRELAERVTESSGREAISPAQTVRSLTSWLQNSGEFEYTLDTSIEDPDVDPVVDFLLNRKRGHCEYFASALALLLRASGIPARYVNGFKGGRYNEDTQQVEIRQFHAHAWVEAYVDGEWIALDPTPAVRDELVIEDAEESHVLTDLVNTVKRFWVMGMALSRDDQRDLIFEPLQEVVGNAVKFFADTNADVMTMLSNREAEAGSDDVDFSKIAVGLLLVSLLAACTYLMWRWRYRRRRGPNGQIRQGRPYGRREVPVYERFRAILARKGHVRRPAQTQREFAAAVRTNWDHESSADAVRQVATAMTTAFYRVRFGNHQLSPHDLRQLNASLDRLEESLTNGDSTNGPADEPHI